MVVLLTSTNAEDVLIVSHFNELAGRITTAAGGGVQSVLPLIMVSPQLVLAM